MKKITLTILFATLAGIIFALSIAALSDKMWPHDSFENQVAIIQEHINALHIFNTTTTLIYIKSGPDYIYPDSSKTPGVTNPDITQDNIDQTICNPKWSTASIRPASSYTTKLKIQQIESGYNYKEDINPSHYEEDHLISLELGGSPKDPGNLWPEPYDAGFPSGGAKAKDLVENYLHKEVCTGQMTLDEAQMLVVTDWYAEYKHMIPNLGASPLSPSNTDD